MIKKPTLLFLPLALFDSSQKCCRSGFIGNRREAAGQKKFQLLHQNVHFSSFWQCCICITFHSVEFKPFMIKLLVKFLIWNPGLKRLLLFPLILFAVQVIQWMDCDIFLRRGQETQRNKRRWLQGRPSFFCTYFYIDLMSMWQKIIFYCAVWRNGETTTFLHWECTNTVT